MSFHYTDTLKILILEVRFNCDYRIFGSNCSLLCTNNISEIRSVLDFEFRVPDCFPHKISNSCTKQHNKHKQYTCTVHVLQYLQVIRSYGARAPSKADVRQVEKIEEKSRTEKPMMWSERARDGRKVAIKEWCVSVGSRQRSRPKRPERRRTVRYKGRRPQYRSAAPR